MSAASATAGGARRSPGAKLAIGSVSLADLKVRQPAASFAGLFDQATLDPFGTGSQVTAERGLDLASAFSFGRFVMQPVDVSAIGFDRLHLDRMSIDDLSMDGLGELTLDGIDVEIADQVSVKLGRLAFGGMAFPKTATIAAALDAAQTGGNVDFSSLAPTLGFFEAGDVDVDIADTPPIRLGRMRIDLANYVGQVPTAVTAAITGADVSTDVIPDDRIRRLLTEFGYQRIHLDAGVKAAWHDGDDTTAVDDFSVKLADIGTLAGKAKFAGPTRADLEQLNSPAGLDRVLAAVSLADATFTFTDDSIVGRAIAGQAARLKVDPTKFREQFARGLPFMLSFLGNRDYQAKVAPVLQAFIRAPGSITFMTTPAAPIALSQIMAAARSAPFSLPNMLALTVTGAAAAGSKPAATGTQAAPAN